MLNYSIRVHSIMVPIEGNSLILPNANVAEVIQYIKPEPVKGTPDWMLGFIKWRELKIPLVLFESLIGSKLPDQKGVKWIMVINSLSGKLDMPFFSLVAQGRPRLVQVDESVVIPMDRAEEKGVLKHVHVHGDQAIIPDPDCIETMLRALSGK